jgi:hypothetical protein
MAPYSEKLLFGYYERKIQVQKTITGKSKSRNGSKGPERQQ